MFYIVYPVGNLIGYGTGELSSRAYGQSLSSPNHREGCVYLICVGFIRTGQVQPPNLHQKLGKQVPKTALCSPGEKTPHILNNDPSSRSEFAPKPANLRLYMHRSGIEARRLARANHSQRTTSNRSASVVPGPSAHICSVQPARTREVATRHTPVAYIRQAQRVARPRARVSVSG